MRSMFITLVAMEDQEPVAECSAEIDLTTFEIAEVGDETFIGATEKDYEGFAIDVDGKIYPVSVDYMATGNEFMLMDAEGIEAVTRIAAENPDMVDGEDDPIDFEDDDE